LDSQQKIFPKTKIVVAQKSDPWFNHQTTFIFKTRIQYKRDQIFQVKLKHEKIYKRNNSNKDMII